MNGSRPPIRHSGESRNPEGWGRGARTTPEPFHQPMHPIFIPWCACASRHERLVRKCAYAAFERAVEPLHSAFSSFRPLNSSFPRRRESRGEVRVVAMTLELSHQPAQPYFHAFVCRRQPARAIPMKACPGLRSGIASRLVTPAKARPVPRHGAGVQRRGESCSAACPQLGARLASHQWPPPL